MTVSKEVDSIWNDISIPVMNHLKIYLLKNHIYDILSAFESKIQIEVSRYLRQLPRHVVVSETDDLHTIAQLEFIETIKVWDKALNADVWPLARRRILGAMKDHIRYITRTDPSRIYEWVADATYLYEVVEEQASFSSKIETDIQLTQAMKVLGFREKRVVVAHTKDGLTFKEIGRSIGLSESQVSRIYKKAIEKMRSIV
ncbi:MAG: sigma-70 family RNA polymerase sigma factor [bacterium]